MRRSGAARPALEGRAGLTYVFPARAQRELLGEPALVYMFLPFLLALAGCASVWRSRAGLSYALWSATIVVTVAWFFHHATDPLKFSF